MGLSEHSDLDLVANSDSMIGWLDEEISLELIFYLYGGH